MRATSVILRSNTPRVDGLVSMMAAVAGPTAACRASRSMSPLASQAISLTVQPHIAAVVGADHGDTGKLALRAGHRREAHGLHAGDFLQHLLEFVHAGQKSLRLRPERMPA